MKKYYIQPIVETTDIRGGFTMQTGSSQTIVIQPGTGSGVEGD